jgi:cellulose synthase/poly-beta-1,6-N-acetylglucosamine synthase-like glycosyltransferase
MDIGHSALYGVLFLSLFFEVFLLISFFERKPQKKTNTLPRHFPSVTIVVPSYNEEKTLQKTVESLLSLSYPKDKLEILIVDDGSKDATREIGQRLASEHPCVRYFYKENGGKYTALNFGIEHSQSDLVGCLDADSFVAQDALIEVVKVFEEKGVSAVVPAMHVYKPRNLLELMQSVEYTFGIFIKKMFDNLAAISVLPGPFSIYRREVFARIGPFRHAHNTEDMEIAFRMHKFGLKIRNAHTAFVYTTVPNTIRALLKQRTRWSQGFLQNSRDYKYMYGNPRYGHFGLLALPFSLAMFFGALYMASYLLWNSVQNIFQKFFDLSTTGIPLHQPQLPNLDWFFIQTNMLTVLAVIVVSMTFTAIMLGRDIGQTRIGWKALLSYFALYGFVVPLWLARALWGALLAREASWR